MGRVRTDCPRRYDAAKLGRIVPLMHGADPDNIVARHASREERAMITEAEIIAALDKPRKLYSIQQRVAPGQKDTEELQLILMGLRDQKKVKFDINSGRWSKA